MDRRTLIGALLTPVIAGTTAAAPALTGPDMEIERFDAAIGGRRPAIMLLHGSDGLTNPGRYQAAARAIASAGYTVFVPHYFDATGDVRASYRDLRTKFPIWRQAIGEALAGPIAAASGIDRNRIGVVGFSLGGALALAASTRSERIKAVVNFFGYLPEELVAARRLAPTLILHGDADRIVPVSNAAAIAQVLSSRGAYVESQIYPGEGHGLSARALPDAISRTANFLGRFV